MKKIANIFLAFAALAFVASSCVDEPEIHEPGEPEEEGCYGVYFPEQENTGTHTYDPTMATVAEIIVNRAVSKGDITVPVTVNDPENAYELSPIHFADGQAETVLEIDFSKVGIGADCPLSVIIEDPLYASKYNQGAISFDYAAFRVEWKYFLDSDGNPAKVHFYETFWGEEHSGYIKYYEVDGIRHCETVSDPIEYSDGTAYGFWGTGAEEGDGEFSFIWYTDTKCLGADGETYYEAIQVPEQTIWYHETYEQDVKFYDYYAYWTILNPQDALAGLDYQTYVTKYGDNYPSSYYDGNGGFYFYAKYYYMIGLGGWGIDDYDPYCIADGFVRVDYSLEAETDYSYEGSVPVYFTSGVDVAEIDYIVVEGELSSSKLAQAVEAISDGSAEDIQKITEFEYYEDENVNESAVEFTLPETGLYTVVAVAIDKDGKAQNNTSIVINFIAAEDEDAYAVKVDCDVEAVPSRYEADPYTTMAYYIVGHDLTDVHFTIVKVSQISQALASAVKYDSKYAVSEDVLKAINGNGGYYTYVTGLAPNTEYAIVVWATNGDLDTCIYSTYTTPRQPYVWESIGVGTITDDVVSPIFNIPNPNPTVECDFYEEKTTPGLYMINNFALKMASALWGEDMTPYGGNWHEVSCIIDATNPNMVTIAEQDYGICCSSAYGFFTWFTVEGAGGILKDGVITFPDKTLITCLPDYNGSAWYTDGLCVITLPGAAVPAAVGTPVYKNGIFYPAEMKTGMDCVTIDKKVIERDIHSVAVEANAIAPKAADKKANRNSAPVKVEKAQIAF